MNRCLDLLNAALILLGAFSHGLLHHVDSLDDDPLALVINFQDAAGLTLVLSCENLDVVILLQFHLHNSYNTSGARETIFTNPPSRSSRATGPKIRLPRGLLLASMTTQALSSNLI